jgi:calcyphosin
VVTMADLNAAYDASKHPAVLKKERTAANVLQEFVASWDKDKNGIITYDEFEDYYKDLSAAIDNDQYFELMIRNAWHISGGEGAAANTSCRRVLVVHASGNQTVREVENDIGVTAKDLERIRAALVRQGVDDIERIELYH